MELLYLWKNASSCQFFYTYWKGVGQNSTPIVVHIEGTDKHISETDFYHALWSDEEEKATVELIPGTYNISYISPINMDGAVYKTEKSQSVSTDKENNHIKANFNKIPAEEVTVEQIEDILKELQTAVEQGDESLKGEPGENMPKRAEKHLKEKKELKRQEEARLETERQEKKRITEEKATAKRVQKARDKAIAAAKAQGLQVFTGTVRIFPTDEAGNGSKCKKL